jgi:protein TonB
MKPFLSVSFLIHLAFLSMTSILFSDFKKESLPTLHVEVILYPWRTEEKKANVSIKKEEKQTPPLPSPTTEVAEPISQLKTPVMPNILVASPEIEVRENPISEVRHLPVEDRRKEVREEETQVDKNPIVLASLIPENVLTPQRAGPSEPLADPSQNLPGEEEKGSLAHRPSLSEGEIILIHPKYAENPKPLYPREARKKGFQGEVVLRVEVLTNGLVGQVEVRKSSGHEILDRSALSAVKEWKFFPAKKGENAIPFWVNIPIKFQLQ